MERSRRVRHVALLAAPWLVAGAVACASSARWLESGGRAMSEAADAMRGYQSAWCRIGAMVGGFVPLNPTLFSELGCLLGDLASRTRELFPGPEVAAEVEEANRSLDDYLGASGRALEESNRRVEDLRRSYDSGDLSRQQLENELDAVRRERDALQRDLELARRTQEELSRIIEAARAQTTGAKGGGGPGLGRLEASARQLDLLVTRGQAQLGAAVPATP